MLFIAAEEFFPGHPTSAERSDWLQTLAVATDELRRHDLTVGFNPWSSVGPWDLGRSNRLGFTPMVSADGRCSEQQASFACPRWLQWITDWYGDLAELRPDVFWLEDDFRFHNHAPMDFGGFEELMLDRFRDRIGDRPTRDEIVQQVLAPGTPHPWRVALQQTWRQAQLEAARAISAAVLRGSGGRSRMGLMSSVPAQHAVEGRDWQQLFAALGPQTEHRPHFGGYSETTPQRVATELALLDQQRPLRPAGTVVAPEIDNWPHTRWSKSHTQTWSQMALAVLSGADALLLCPFTFYGSDPEDTPDIDELLDTSRPSLSWLADRTGPGRRRRGVRVVWSETVSSRLELRPGARWPDLVVDPTPVASYLARNGVPVSADDDGLAYLAGGVVDALSDEELRTLLGGRLLVDGDAAERIDRRGFGDLLGVRVSESVPRLESSPDPYALERVVGPGSEPTALPIGTTGSVNHQPRLTRFAVDGGVAWTDIFTPTGRHWGAGRVAHVNRLGGRIVVTAAHAVADLPAGDVERSLLQAAVRFCWGGDPPWPMVTGGPHLCPVVLDSESERVVAVVNGSGDPETIAVAGVSGEPTGSWLLAPLADPQMIDVEHLEGRLVPRASLPSRSLVVIVLPPEAAQDEVGAGRRPAGEGTRGDGQPA